METLSAEGDPKLVPGKPEESRLLEVVATSVVSSRMPKDSKPLTTDEIEVLRRWIAAGAQHFWSSKSRPRPRIESLDVLRAIRDDLVQQDDAERKARCYITLQHLHNSAIESVNDDTLRHYRAAVSKLLNSLSNQADITPPRVLDHTSETVLVVDLRDYGWDTATWNLLVDRDEQNRYPYDADLPELPGQSAAADIARQISDVAFENTTKSLFIRADWFLKAASKPPLYRALLRLPDTVEKLTRDELRVSDKRLLRAGLSVSGVALSFRVLERRGSQFGSFTQSFDFAPGNGRSNPVEFPFGPRERGSIDEPFAFEPDGGEIIYHLPNGMLAFAIVGNGASQGVPSSEVWLDSADYRRAR